jgi:hypothetical protein
MENIKKFAGSVSTEDFINGLFMMPEVNTLGDIWEKFADCRYCQFVEQCQAIGDYFDTQDKNPSCGQILDFLTGELKEEDIK